jgi:hypothetical protein
MKILLIELETKGHHITSYLRTIINRLLKKNYKIYLLTTKPKNSEILKFHEKIKIFYVKKNKNLKKINYFNLIYLQLKNYFTIKLKFKKISKKNYFDIIYLNNLDHIDKILSILGSPFGKVYFYCLFLNPKILHNSNFNFFNFLKVSIYKFLFYKILNIKTLKKVFILNPLCYKQIPKHKLKKIELLNEIGTYAYKRKISQNRIECRKLLNLDKSYFVILVYGSIRKDKELIYLIDVIKKFYINNKIKIIIAGLQDEYTKKLLRENIYNNAINEKFLIINKFVNDTLEQVLFKSSNLVWTGYSKDFTGSSGVFFLSSMNKVPVITSDHGLINWNNKKYKIGKSTNLRDPNKVKKVIDYFLKNKRLNLNNSFIKTNYIHNSENFSKKIEKNFIENKNINK